MLTFYQKRKLKEFIHSWLVLLLLILISIPLSISVYERYNVEREMASRRAAIEVEKEALSNRKQVLEERVEYLKDDRGIEAEIRRHFDVAKEGEQVVIILEDEIENEATVGTMEDEAPKIAPWYMFWR